MGDIVEHVERAIAEGAYKRLAEIQRLPGPLRAQRQACEQRSRITDTIRATLEYLREKPDQMARACFFESARMQIAPEYQDEIWALLPDNDPDIYDEPDDFRVSGWPEQARYLTQLTSRGKDAYRARVRAMLDAALNDIERTG